MRRYRFLILVWITVFVGTGDVSAVVLPNPDPTAPHFTEGWWLQMLVLAGFSIAFGFVIVLFGRWLKRQDDADEKQDKRIDALGSELNKRTEALNLKMSTCQVQCASHRGEMVKRDDFEGRMLRMEEMIVRIHERVDQIGIAVGVNEAIRKGE